MVAGAAILASGIALSAIPAGAMTAPTGAVSQGLPVNPLNPLNPLPGLGGAVGGLAGGLAKDTAGTVLGAVAAWVASGVASMLGSVAAAINTNLDVQLGRPWLVSHYGVMLGIAVLLATPFLLATAITAIIKQDLALVVRATFVQLPVAAVAAGVGIELVALAVAITDALCRLVTGSLQEDTTTLFAGLAHILLRDPTGAGGFGLVLVALFLGLGAMFLSLEMVVRSAAIYVAVLFLPLALVGMTWPGTARWGRRLAEVLAALILSKFVVVAVVSMAVDAVGSGLFGSGLSALLGGGALLLLAAFAPFALLRMAPVVEAGVVGHLDGMGRRATSAPPIVRQAAHQEALDLLRARSPDSGPPDVPADSVPTSSTPAALPTRGRDADGTQVGPDKPTPVGAGVGGQAPVGAGSRGPADLAGASSVASCAPPGPASTAAPSSAVGAEVGVGAAAGAVVVAAPALAAEAGGAVLRGVEGAADPSGHGDG